LRIKLGFFLCLESFRVNLLGLKKLDFWHFWADGVTYTGFGEQYEQRKA
jgi:hypothetical protein